jgi:alanine racemase
MLVQPGSDLGVAVTKRIDLAVSSRAVLDDTIRAAVAAGTPARVHVKVDTGLGRGGATAQAWPDLVDAVAKAQADGHIEVVGVWSHLACADLPGHQVTARQLAAFGAALDVAERAGVHPEVRHVANSAGLLAVPDSHLDLVRPGIAVYGLSAGAGCDPPSRYGLRPAMTVIARVALTKRVPAGHGVSYGHRYHTNAETTLALVPFGYADGVPRAAGNTTEVFLGGRRRRIAGTVCMDQFVVDVGDDPICAGDEVIVFGTGDHGEPTADEWAAALDTIGYEIVTRIGPRVPRRYLGANA